MEYELTSDDSDHDDSGLIGKRKTLRAYSPQIRRRIVVGVAVGLVIIIIILGVGLGAGLGNSGSSRSTCEQVDKLERFNCFPGRNTNAAECSRRGCCWNDEVTDNSPRCYYAADYVQGYEVSSVEHSDLGPMLYLSWLKKSYFSADQFPYPGAVEKLAVKALFETNNRLHVKIYDPANKRYEVPIELQQGNSMQKDYRDYEFSYTKSPFSFVVKRTSTGTVLFNTNYGSLVFSDQFLQISSSLPSDLVYGLGEHIHRRSEVESKPSQRIDLAKWTTVTLFTRDIFPEDPAWNLYGVHPFYLAIEPLINGERKSYGVLFLNSNAMDIALQPLPAITYRTTGGIMDFYFFVGDTPEDVIQQYTALIGHSFMPPYWSLGFHLCRWGYGTANKTQEVVDKMRSLGIPQDVQWNDIDYMRDYLDFTYDKEKFGLLPQLVQHLHNNNQKYIMIVDPGISITQPPGSYPPYDQGLKLGIFINVSKTNNIPIVGQVWPGKTAFPDFTNPQSTSYWTEMIQNFHNEIPFDGLWIDMNEPSNFVQGSINGCPKSSLNDPPFLPGIVGDKLYDKTLCMTSQQTASEHYNVHSLYGHTESIATAKALQTVLQKRSLVISRSTFVSSGHYVGHWLGDNQSTWSDLARSITGILDFSLFGISMVGVDICGFGGHNTTEELCTRWMELGSFYPFSRNHNANNKNPQDPASFSENVAVPAMRNALTLRYKLLPYLYTLFYQAHINGTTVARPLFFEFPNENMFDIGYEFMWGKALLIAPLLEEGADKTDVVFPPAYWYDFHTGSPIVEGISATITVNAPLGKGQVPLFIRGGYIVPSFHYANTTTQDTQKNPFWLTVANGQQSADGSRHSIGDLFLDDGESLINETEHQHTLIKMHYQDNHKQGRLRLEATISTYSPYRTMILAGVDILGMSSNVTIQYVQVNNDTLPTSSYLLFATKKLLRVTLSASTTLESFTLLWQARSSS